MVSAYDGELDEVTIYWLRRYSFGEVTWRELRDRLDTDNFNVVLTGLQRLGLSLPRSDPNRPTKARAWLRGILAQAKANSPDRPG